MAELNSNIEISLGEVTTTTTVPNPRTAHIAGGNAVLFRFSNPDERALGSLGTYTQTPTASPAPSPTVVADTEYDWPNKPATGVVDLNTVSLYVVDGLLKYYTDTEVSVVANAGVNKLQSSSLVFATNTVADRDALFLDRDCQVDDIVVISAGGTTLRSTITAIDTDADGENTVLTLKDDLPTAIRNATEVSLSLYIPVDSVEVPYVKEEASGEFNYTFDANSISINDSITMFEDSWTDSDVPQALELTEGELIVQYRAWVTTKTNAVFTCEDTTDLDDIPGALHPANPLKWGVYVALQHSAGVEVKYTAVADPDSLTDWEDMLDWLGDDLDIYGLVPLTHNQAVWALYTAYVTASRTNGHPLCVWTCPEMEDVVLYEDIDATITEDGDSGEYTVVTAATGQFQTDGVVAGDVVDFEFETDAWGREVYSSGTVVTVYSEQSLLIDTGPTTEIAVAERIKIRRPLTAAVITSELQDLAEELDNRYVRLVWPDVITTNGYTDRAGYYLAAMLAGLRSGSYPHRSLSNVELTGISSNTRMTMLNVTQRTALDAAGVWVVNATPSGSIITRHGVTTAQTDEADYREEAVVSNVDGIEYDIRCVVADYSGKSNVNATIIRHVGIAIRKLFIELSAEPTLALGPRVFAGTITSLSSSTTVPDSIIVTYNVTVPTPFNHLEIIQQITAGLNIEVTT